MYLIVRKHEIAPSIWGSKPIVIGSTPSAAIAEKTAADLNAAEDAKEEMQRRRRLRTRYAVTTSDNN